jgi:hypothetical protein
MAVIGIGGGNRLNFVEWLPKFTRQVQRRYRPELHWERSMISSTWTSALRCRGFMKPAHRVVRSAGSSGGAPRPRVAPQYVAEGRL